MNDPSSLWPSLITGFFSKHAAVIFGLAVGSAAKFGRMLSEGAKPSWSQVFGHVMMMAMVGLVATFLTDIASIDEPTWRAFTASILAIAANDVIKYLATRGWRQLLQDPVEARGELRNEVQTKISAKRLVEGDDQ